MAFLKFIFNPEGNRDFPQEWLETPDKAFRRAEPRTKALFVLDQAVAISYLGYLYGKGTVLLREFYEHFLLWYYQEVADLQTQSDDPVVKAAYIGAAILLKKMPGRVDSTELIKLLNLEDPYPRATANTFYEPYLKFKEYVTDLTQYVENDQLTKSRSFNIGHAVAIPAFKVEGHFLTANCQTEFPSYSFSYPQLKDMIEDLGEVDSVYTFLAGYKWSGRTSVSVMGVLAAQCITTDYYDVDLDSPMLGFLDIYNKVIEPVDLPEHSREMRTAIMIQRRKIVRFMVYMRRRHRMVWADVKLLADYVDSVDTDDNHPLKSYLLEDNPANISSEVYTAFRNSRFGRFEELDKFRVGYRNAADGEVDDKKDDDTDQDDQESSTKKSKAAPGSDGQDTVDALKGLESPTRIQDSSQDTQETNDAGTDTSETAAQPDSEQNQPDASEDATTEEDKELPPLPRVSDKNGVQLKLSEGESPDTVLYREELRAYIDALLNNPPSSLSVQAMDAIRRLKAHWLYLLDVKCLYDFMSAIIRLPKSLKVKPPKKEK